MGVKATGIVATSNSLSLKVKIETTDLGLQCMIRALVNCGATSLFMDRDWVKNNNITTRMLSCLIPVYNVDRTPKKAGAILEVVTVVLQYEGHKVTLSYYESRCKA